MAAALLGGGVLLLWLDRWDRSRLAWLAGCTAWAAAVPALLRLAAPFVSRVLSGTGGGPDAAQAPAADPALAVTAPLLAVLLPLGLAASRRRLEGPTHGAVFGMVVGVGFAAAGGRLILAGSVQPTPALLMFLVVLHAAAGATLGAGTGMSEVAAPSLRPLYGLAAAAAAALEFGALAFGALACWKEWGETNTAVNLALGLGSAAALAATLAVCLSHERSVIAEELGEEVTLDVLPPWVADVLPSYRRRIRPDWWPRRDERREIVRLLVALAFRKHQLRSLPDEQLRLYGLEVGRLRQRARTLMSLAPSRETAAETPQ